MEGPAVTIGVDGGVTIVENAGLHVADSLAWAFDTIPTVSIGVPEGDPEYVFGDVAGFLALPDGTVLIADGLANELRVYDRGGLFLRSVGRTGQGPGEFLGITAVRLLAGDSIAVLNTGESDQIDVLDPSLEFVRRHWPVLSDMTAEPPFTSDMLDDIFADGRVLMGDYVGVCATGAGVLCADSVRFMRTDETGVVLARFGERHVYERGFSGRVGTTNVRWRGAAPQPIWTVHGDRFYYGDPRRFEILVFASDGSLERRIRVAGAAARWSMEEIFPELPPAADPRMQEMRRGVRELQLSSPLPDSFPAFADLVVDETGHLWVREYVPPGAMSNPPRWFVFDPEGRLRYSLRSPWGLVRAWRTVTRPPPPLIGDSTALGIRTDALGLERVVRYRLIKGG